MNPCLEEKKLPVGVGTSAGAVERMMRRAGESLTSWKRRLAKRSKAMRRRPGRSWRILAQGGRDKFIGIGTVAGATEKHRATGTVFDELVIDDWLHLEQMDTRHWWLNLGDRDLVIGIYIPKRGSPKIKITERKRPR